MIKYIFRLLKAAALKETDDDSLTDVPSNTKRRTLVKCLFRLLINCGSKRKNFLFAQKNQLKKDLYIILEEDIHKGVPANMSKENQLNEFKPLIKDYLNLLNVNQSSPLSSCVLEVLISWIKEHKSRSPIVISLLTQLSSTVISWPSGFSKAAESLLDAYFYYGDEDELQNQNESPPEWSFVLEYITFLPTNVKEILDSAVKMGHLLVLVTYVRKKKVNCKSIREEEVLLSSILDWFRQIQLSEENEPKLPLLYTEYLSLCHRQLLYGDSESKVVGFLLQFLESLAPLTSDSSTVGNILGAIGLSSQYKLTPRARFLALSLMLFLYAQITTDGKIRKNIPCELQEHKENENQDEMDNNGKERAEVTNTRIQLYALKQNKAYIGLTESIDWVLNNTAEKNNTIEATREFIACLVVDKLYVESYLKED
uniref:Ectopic P granules protein 5 homolog [Megachile rotundata] n=1 Tax=Lepeophtheirus salmonis TaxID=72036 RepID=A0A0K2V8P6_LEPSM